MTLNLGTLSYGPYCSPGPSPPPCIRITSIHSTYSCTPKMEAARSFEMSVFIYQSTDMISQTIAVFTLATVRGSVLAPMRYSLRYIHIFELWTVREKVIKLNFSLMHNINYDGSLIKIKSLSSNNVWSRHAIANPIKICLEFQMWKDKPVERTSHKFIEFLPITCY
jgi:hypothetical protein